MTKGKELNRIKLNAEAYKRLLNIEYEFIIGIGKQEYRIRVIFPEDKFSHLAGIEQLKDLAWRPKRGKDVFRMALSGKITEEMLKASTLYRDKHIAEKTAQLYLLEYMLDTYEIVFHCQATKTKTHEYRFCGAKMFICKNQKGETFFLLFSKETTEKDEYVQISFRTETEADEKDPRDYSKNVEARLLKKTKINRVTGERTVLYQNEGYSPKNDYKVDLP